MLENIIESREASTRRGENQERNLSVEWCISTDIRSGNDPFE